SGWMTNSDSTQPTDLQGGVSKRLVLLLAVTCGAAAANLYYAQPLLHTIGGAFSVSNGTAGLLVTVSQIGYAIGLAFVVPLGGLLIGILTARTASGVLAGLFGWRGVFVIAAATMVTLAALLRWALPEVPPTEDLPYRSLLRSVVRLVREEPLLRQRMVLGAAS